jgi:hypothetical protein
MCQDREGGVFVASNKPAAEMGWWVGRILRKSGKFYSIEILYSENGTNSPMIWSLRDCFVEFDTMADAFDYLKARGVSMAAA